MDELAKSVTTITTTMTWRYTYHISIFAHTCIYVHVLTHTHLHQRLQMNRVTAKNLRDQARCGNGFHLKFMEVENFSTLYSLT